MTVVDIVHHVFCLTLLTYVYTVAHKNVAVNILYDFCKS